MIVPRLPPPSKPDRQATQSPRPQQAELGPYLAYNAPATLLALTEHSILSRIDGANAKVRSHWGREKDRLAWKFHF
jgi:hypothetical protein